MISKWLGIADVVSKVLEKCRSQAKHPCSKVCVEQGCVGAKLQKAQYAEISVGVLYPLQSIQLGHTFIHAGAGQKVAHNQAHIAPLLYVHAGVGSKDVRVLTFHLVA